MSKKGWIILGTIGGLVIVTIIAIVGITFLFVITNQKEVSQAENDGMEFGKTVDQIGCMEEGLKRSKNGPFKLNNIKDSLLISTFTESCIKSSRPVQNFCADVPRILEANEHEWSIKECEKVNLDDEETNCRAVFNGKYNFCNFQKSAN